MKRTKEQLEKDYQLMVEKTVSSPNRVNCYKCNECGHITKTYNADEGVTPMFHSCEKCNSNATSTMFNDIAPEQEPTQEWYRPTLSATSKMSAGMQDHILLGGLDVRPIKKQTLEHYRKHIEPKEKKVFRTIEELLSDEKFQKDLKQTLIGLEANHRIANSQAPNGLKRGPYDRLHELGIWNVDGFIYHYKEHLMKSSSLPSVLRLYIQGAILSTGQKTLKYYEQ